MTFQPTSAYHVYNRSFSKTPVFINDGNFTYFLSKISTLKDYCDILAYCLMPDHFHLMIYMTEEKAGLTRQTASSGQTGMQILSRKIGTLLSSYTQAYNKQENRTGSLFQPKTKAKELIDPHHALASFHYIHQNPLRSGLVKKMEDWPYSSFNEYYLEVGTICNKTVAAQVLDLPLERKAFYNNSTQAIPDFAE